MGTSIGLNATNCESEKARLHEELTQQCSLIERVPTQPVMKGSDFTPQFLACLAATSTSIQTGINLAFSAILLPQLMMPQSVVPITKDQATWIASIVTISTTVGSLLSGPLMDRFGRRAICKLSCVPLILSWITIAFIKNVPGIYVGRLLAGFGAGLSTASLVYVAEVSHPKWRPGLLCLISVFVSLGILLTFSICIWLSYDQMAICFAVMSLGSFLATLPLPESPYWLMRHRTEKMAMKALHWLNRRDECYQYQASCLIDSFKQPSAPTSKQKSLSEYFSPYKQSSTIKPIVIVLLIFVFQQISGAYVIIFYALNILQIAGGKFGTGISEYAALVSLGLIRFSVSIFTAFISRKCGRRPVYIVSGIGMAISMLVAAICIDKGGDVDNLFISRSTHPLPYSANLSTNSIVTMPWSRSDEVHTNMSLDENSEGNLNKNARYIHHDEVPAIVRFNLTDFIAYLEIQDGTFNNSSNFKTAPEIATDDQWLPIACVILYVLFSSIGVLVIPWTLIGELLPTCVRGSCGGFIMAFAYVAMFAVIKTFPYFLQVVTVRGMFYTFSASSFSGAVFVYFCLPETRGRTFQEIEAYFK